MSQSVQSHTSIKIGLTKAHASNSQLQDERRRYLAEGYTERPAVDSKGEKFSYWYKATGQGRGSLIKMIGPKTVENEVIL